MAESICSNFTIENDNAFEVSQDTPEKLVNIIQCLVTLSPLYSPCITPSEKYFEENNVFSVNNKIEDSVKLDAYNTEWVSNTGWSELEHCEQSIRDKQNGV